MNNTTHPQRITRMSDMHAYKSEIEHATGIQDTLETFMDKYISKPINWDECDKGLRAYKE